MSAELQVKAFIERILRLKEEQDTLAYDIREVYAEAKGHGYDKTALGEVVSYLRKIEKKGRDAVDERTAMFDLYLSAYEQPSHTHAPARTREASEVTEHEQPGTATGSEPCLGHATDCSSLAAHEADESAATISPSAAPLTAEPEAVSPTPPAASGTISPSSGIQGVTGGNPSEPSPDAGAENGIARAMAANAQSEQAAHHFDDDVPAFLKQERVQNQPNPKCQKPGSCKWDHGQVSCWRCNSAPAVRESVVA